MRSIEQQFNGISKLLNSIDNDVAIAEDDLARAYRGEGTSKVALARVEHVKQEYIHVAHVARAFKYLAHGSISPLGWIQLEKYIRESLQDAFDFYENQNVMHPQELRLQYPPEWEPKLQ